MCVCVCACVFGGPFHPVLKKKRRTPCAVRKTWKEKMFDWSGQNENASKEIMKAESDDV